MTHKIHMIVDFQYGSTGKGLIAGYLAKTGNYDTAICAFSPNAGHTYRDGELNVMTQQLPTAGLISPSVRNILIGPGASIHLPTLRDEMLKYGDMLVGKRVYVHEHAQIVTEEDIQTERDSGMSKIGSTTKGVGAAAIQRIRRDPLMNNSAGNFPWLITAPSNMVFVVNGAEYRDLLSRAENVIIEGAQGFSLSIYHGQYPYTTSRDVTPWQIAADCGLPFTWASKISIIGTLRTYPIRVNNRDGTSGPCYPDQEEITFESLDLEPELTTVTKLPRRIFTFSQQQLDAAMFHCGHYWGTSLFLNFANYLKGWEEIRDLIAAIERPRGANWNPPVVHWIGMGPEHDDILTREQFVRELKSRGIS